MFTPADLELDQLAAIDFINERCDALLCADVGTGKTVIALTAADRALKNGDVKRFLTLAPRLVALDTWMGEPAQWSHLQHLRLGLAMGTPEQRKAVIDGDDPIVVINYENLLWLLTEYPQLPFDGILYDEIDFLKEVRSKRFKMLRRRVKHFNLRVGFTGTITPNKLLELWAPVFLLDGGESFGRSFYKFRDRYFYPIDFHQHTWVPLPDSYDIILNRLKGLAYRLKSRHKTVPVLTEPVRCNLPIAIKPYYKELENEYFLVLKDSQRRSRIIDVESRAVLQVKLQQLCAGFSYVDPVGCHQCNARDVVKLPKSKGFICADCKTPLHRDVIWHSRVKFEKLDVLRASLGDQQRIIFYYFDEEREELLRRIPGLPVLSGLSDGKARQLIADWNAGRIIEMALHPMSAAHGLNLQKSAAHHMAFLTWPWSGGKVKQAIGRLVRRGQLSPHVFIHSFIFNDTVDERVIATVREKLDNLEDFHDDLELVVNA